MASVTSNRTTGLALPGTSTPSGASSPGTPIPATGSGEAVSMRHSDRSAVTAGKKSRLELVDRNGDGVESDVEKKLAAGRIKARDLIAERDRDGDGKLQGEELDDATRGADRDGDGIVTQKELRRQFNGDISREDRFKGFDSDGNGVLEGKELTNDWWARGRDHDGDGKVTLEEFRKGRQTEPGTSTSGASGQVAAGGDESSSSAPCPGDPSSEVLGGGGTSSVEGSEKTEPSKKAEKDASGPVSVPWMGINGYRPPVGSTYSPSRAATLVSELGPWQGRDSGKIGIVGPAAGRVLDMAYEALSRGDRSEASKLYQEAARTGSPVMLDLNGDGKLGTTGVSTARDRMDGQVGRTVSFDIDGDGTRDSIEWMKGPDGMLVDDREGAVTAAMNGNGEIDGRQLFGDEGGRFGNGYEKLDQLDRNGDGRLAGDELSGLKVWVDDGNARVDQGELRTLAELGVTDISTRMELEKNERGEDLMRSTFTRNGQTQVSEDVWFAHDR